MIAAWLVLILAAVGLVRLGWGGRRGAAAAGWTLTAVALLMLTLRDGAWGLAIGTVAGMLAALALLLHAGVTSPARASRPRREPPSIVLPRRWADLARRVLVFVLVVPVAFVAAEWFSFAAQAVVRRAGAADADTLVLALFLQPTVWAALMTWQITRSGPARMIAPPAMTALLGTALWCAS